jgi:hypothetical protein
VTPAEWARGVVAAHETKKAPAGQGRGTTESRGDDHNMTTVPLPAELHTPWADTVEVSTIDRPAVTHSTTLTDIDEAGQNDGLYIEAQRTTTVLADSIEVSPPTLSIDGFISTGVRRLTIVEAELLASELLHAISIVAPATKAPNAVAEGQGDDMTYASLGYRDEKPHVFLQVADDSNDAVAVRMLTPGDAIALAKQLKAEARQIERRAARDELEGAGRG